MKIKDYFTDFNIRHLSDYWSKWHRRKCVWKLMIYIFWKQKNFSSCLNPLWFLVQLRKFQKMSSSFLNPSSIAAEIKGDWGRVGKIEIFGKYDRWRFERTSSHVFWTNSRWENFIFVKAPGGTVWRFLCLKKKPPLKLS